MSAGNYSLAGQDGNGCPFTALNLVVNNIQVPVSVSLGNDTTTCTFKGFDLKPGTYQSYLWQDNSINPTFKVTSSGTYWVTVTNSQGCTGSDTVKVTIDCSDVYFPGAFTPNGDGKNDGFGPIGTAVSKIRNFVLRVYDRYGEPVYYSTDPYKKWDGTLKGSKFNSGTFTWFATYNLDGKGGDQQSGTVILLR